MVVHRTCVALPGGEIFHDVIYLQCVIVCSLQGPPLFLSRSPPPLHQRLNYSALKHTGRGRGPRWARAAIGATTTGRIQFSLDYEFWSKTELCSQFQSTHWQAVVRNERRLEFVDGEARRGEGAES